MKKASILTNARLFADLLIVICSTRSGAQHGTGTLAGSSGAAVRHASTSIENAQSAVTDGSDAYEVPSLRTGMYSIEAGAPGILTCQSQEHRRSCGWKSEDRLDKPAR